MLSREPAFYRDFRCLGGACPLTCCRDWDIVVDKESLADYATAPEGLRQTIAAALITDEEGDVCFRLASDGRCALLDEDGLCPIQRRWGEDTCANTAPPIPVLSRNTAALPKPVRSSPARRRPAGIG